MSGDVPLVETRSPITVMNHPARGFENVPINFSIAGNNHLAFVLNNVHLSLARTTAEETTCGGLHCDKQRLDEWVGLRGCGCHRFNTRRSNIAITHVISFVTGDTSL